MTIVTAVMIFGYVFIYCTLMPQGRLGPDPAGIKKSFTFAMDRIIGEGYLEGGGAGSYRMTSMVKAGFDKNGQLKTLYPLIHQ